MAGTRQRFVQLHIAETPGMIPVARIGARDRRKEGLRISMLGCAADLFRIADFDELTLVHNADAVAHVADDADVMADEDVGEPELVLQAHQEIEHLRAHGDIERRGRLVGNDDTRIERDGAGNADALALTAGECVRVAFARPRIEAHLLHEVADPFYNGETANNNVGVAVGLGGKAGAFSYQITAGYDTDNEEGAVRAMGTVAVGPGTLGLAVVYATNPNAYYNKAEWAIAAEYAIKATDKLKITPAVQYYDNYGVTSGEFNDDVSAWKAGVTIDYQIVDNFSAKVSVQYLDPDNASDVTSGYFRLQRAF